MKVFSWLVLLLLLGATLVGALRFDRRSWPSLVGDEATYMMAAQSLAWDFDVRYTRGDYDRFVAQWGVKPDGLIDGHPGTSTAPLFEAFLQKVVGALQANQQLWQDTVIIILFDEAGGYYDSGYVQPIDFFGDGPRVPLIAVSPFAKQGYVDHAYTDHASILKFIEYNWRLAPLSLRSRDNLPNPTASANAYVPGNPPAIGDLTTLFDFN